LPLKVLLIAKDKPSRYARDDRSLGWWSYPVPEFEWTHYSPGTPFSEFRKSHKDRCDLIFHENDGNYGCWVGDGPPLIYLTFDAQLSQDHYARRLAQANQADLILLDDDAVRRFAGAGVPVRRWAHCVNDHVFYDRQAERTVDVSFHCSSGGAKGCLGADERSHIRQVLSDFCKGRGYSYRSGTRPLLEYAESMAQSKIVVNVPRTIAGRPHRIFDAPACGACLLTRPFAQVEGDGLIRNAHYVQWCTEQELLARIDELLTDGKWARYGQAGHDYVMAHHTWAMRARELRQILAEQFGLGA